MARFNKIFAGPVSENLPQVQEAPADIAILPGVFAVITSGEFVVATADTHAKLFVTQDNYLIMKGVDDTYAAGETVIGMELLDGQLFNVRFPTGVDVTRGAAITIGTGGKGKLAAAEDFVVAFAEEAYNNTSGVDQLVRVRAARGFYLPAA
jgi:hypothetical protein